VNSLCMLRLAPRLDPPWFTLAITAVALVVWLIPGAGYALSWQPDALPWRLCTSQLSHWDGNHLLWDSLAVLLLGMWSECCWPRAARLAIVLSLIAIPPIVVVSHTDLAFRGLSGIAFALAAVAAFQTWRTARTDRDATAAAVSIALLLSLVGKMAYEVCVGQAVFASAESWKPVPIAHAVGLLVGWFACLRLPSVLTHHCIPRKPHA